MWRALTKSPGFALTAIGMTALGIAVTTSIFSIASATLLRPLPYADPSRLLLISAEVRQNADLKQFSWARFEFIRDHAQSYSTIAAFAEEDLTLTGVPRAEQLTGARVSPAFFDLLGIRPEPGRSFLPSEGTPGGPFTVILSHELWTRRFNSDRAILGRPIQLDGRDYTVVGVLPAGFQFLPLAKTVDAFIPRPFELNALGPAQMAAGASYLTAVGRLKPGITQAQAQAEMVLLDRGYQREKPGLVDADPNLRVVTLPLQDQIVSGIRPALLVLLGAVGFVLLIACANIAGLLLARALDRRKEVAIRVALGASRSAIVRQLLRESLRLAAIGGIAGTALSWLGTKALVSLAAADFPLIASVTTNWTSVTFAAAISLICGVLFGIIPAWQISKTSIEPVLRADGGRSTGTRQRHLTRNLLIVSQIALSVVLLTGAGLLIRSFARLRTIDTGIQSANLLTMSVDLTPAHYNTPAKQIGYYREALDRIAAIPGVNHVAISSALPITPARLTPMLIEGQPPVPLRQRPIILIQMISPDYAQTLGIPLLEGRAFTSADDANAPLRAVVNRAFARRYWPDQNPIGKTIIVGLGTKATEVVGVFGDVRNTTLAGDPDPELFTPFPQHPWAYLNITVRTATTPSSFTEPIRRELNRIDPDQPVTHVQTIEALLDSARVQPRLLMVLVAIFSTCASLMAAAGLYGVIAYSVSQRTRELGVRVALGADANGILRLILGQASVLAGAGILLGVGAAMALTRILASQLYKVSATDPLVFAAGAALFAIVALLASAIPAHRAATLSPVEALRSD
ncbi:MAG TPA: ABC transporter permease [Bryobacteraceae bacterium]|nr:ABC transporter permease [Bryobacteraceae bacterium]